MAGTYIWGPWLGAPTPDGLVAVTGKVSTDTAAVTLEVSTSNTLSSPTVFGPEVPDENGIVRFEVTGLNPSTRYYCRLNVDGTDATTHQGTFRTAPPVGQPADFKLVFSSCSGGTASVPTYSNHRSLDAVAAEDPDLFLHLGDLSYADPETTVLAEFIDEVYDTAFTYTRMKNLIHNVPWGYMYSDHDAGVNGCDKTAATREVCRQAYRTVVPHPPLGMTDADTDDDVPPAHEIVWGRVRIIMLDGRLERDVTLHALEEEAGRSRLGAAQKAWLFDRLLAATEPLLLINVEGPWITKPGPSDDHWAAYIAERQEILDFLVENELHHRVALIEGDGHFLAMDNGDHNYGTGIPVYNASPLDRGADTYSGPYTHGPLANPAGDGHYIVLDIQDDGGREITINGHGIKITGSDGTRTEVMTLTGIKRGPLALETRKTKTPAGIERVDAAPFDPTSLSPAGQVFWLSAADLDSIAAGTPTKTPQGSNKLSAWVLAKSDAVSGTIMFPPGVRRVKAIAVVSKGNATATGSGRLQLQRQWSLDRGDYSAGENRANSTTATVPLGTDQGTTQPSSPSEFVPPGQYEILHVALDNEIVLAEHDPRSMGPAPLYRFMVTRVATGDTFTGNISLHAIQFLAYS